MPTLISNVRVFCGELVLHKSGHVLVENGRIKAVTGENKPSDLPDNVIQIDGSGCTLLPGLIDAHVHVHQDVAYMERAVRCGVTTVIDLHNEPEWFQEMRQIATERNDVSDIKGAGFAATIKDGWPSTMIKMVANNNTVSATIIIIYLLLLSMSLVHCRLTLHGSIA